MNKILNSVVVMLAAACASGLADPVWMNSETNNTVVFLGDSITAQGVHPDGYITLVSAAVSEAYPDRDIQVIGAGVGGNKVTDCQERLDRDVLLKNPAVVMIYIGINDVWHWTHPKVVARGGKGTSREDFESGLLDLIDRIARSGARVILCTPSVIGEKAGGTNPQDRMLDEYSGISRKVAAETGVQLLDLRKEFVKYLAEHNPENAGRGILTRDSVHLNPEGNRFLAGLVLDALDVPRAGQDILLADFEGGTYGGWTVEGTAFGTAPVQANLAPPKNKVAGHQGTGLVNTYLGGDESTGTLTSPEFTLERKYINFLIGAGNHDGKTCMNLLIDGKVVRTAVGWAQKDEGCEVLDWKSWDVEEFAGKKVTLQIVDSYAGRPWGHINVDHIVQSDVPGTPAYEFTEAVVEDFSSKVPKVVFADTLEEQETQLADNPLLERFRVSRKKILTDPHHPLYHFTSPENALNDPNGLSFWKGNWHLFYQGYPPEDSRQHWGHAVSSDLIHWRDLPYAIYPDPERACYSGSALVEDDRVIAMYYGTTVGCMVAVSDDPLLLNWEKMTGQAVIPHARPGEPELPYNIFDPCIWKHGDFYYALTAGQSGDGPGGKRVRAEFLHRSKDLATWEYLHPFLENDRYGEVGDDGACPYFWPIGDKHILLHFSHMTGGKYMLGDYDTDRDKFVVTDGADFNFGAFGPCGIHAPSATPDGQGGVIVIFNVNEGKRSPGWNRMMSLPRRLTLREGGFLNPLNIEPAGDVESLRGGHVQVGAMDLPASREIVLDRVQGSALEMMAEFEPQKGQTLELNVLRSADGEEVTRIQCFRDRGYRVRGSRMLPAVVSIDSAHSTLDNVLCRPPETAQVDLDADEPLKLRVFIDRSIVEVFINGRQCVSARVYPGREDSVGVSLRAMGKDARLTSLDAWQMNSIYENLRETE